MNISRTVIAFIVALSVALLPAAGRSALVAKSDEMSMSEAMADCCDHHTMPCHKSTMNDCGSTTACALLCFGFLGVSFSDLALPLTLTAAQPSWASDIFPSRTSNPPFHPPRI